MLNVTPQMLQTGATSCYSTAQNVADELASLRAYVQELAAQWLGVSSMSYQNLMTDYDRYGKMLNDALTRIGDGLVGNMHNYATTESTIDAGLVAVNGAIPGARLD